MVSTEIRNITSLRNMKHPTHTGRVGIVQQRSNTMHMGSIFMGSVFEMPVLIHSQPAT